MADDTTQRDIGQLEGEIKHLTASVDRLSQAVAQQNANHTEEHRRIDSRISSLDNKIGIFGELHRQVRDKSDGVEKRINDEVVPALKTAERRRALLLGGTAVVMFLMTTGGFLVGWGWDVIVAQVGGGP